MKFGRNLVFLLPVLIGLFFVPGVCRAAPVMVEKNLFSQDRKPPPPESATPAQKPGKPGISHNAVQLDGVMVIGDVKKALLRTKGQAAGADRKKQQSPYVTVREGQKFSDYQVVKIEQKSVSLEKDGETFVIGLFSEGKVVTPVTATPAPPVAGVQGGGRPGRPPEGPGAHKGRPPRPGRPGGPVPDSEDDGHSPGMNNPTVRPHYPPDIAQLGPDGSDQDSGMPGDEDVEVEEEPEDPGR